MHSPRVILAWRPEIGVVEHDDPNGEVREVPPGLGVEQTAFTHVFEPALFDVMKRDDSTMAAVVQVESERAARQMLPHLEVQIAQAMMAALWAARK